MSGDSTRAFLRLSSGITLVVSLGLGASCAAHPVQPSVPLGSPFELRAGASATLPQGLKVTFDSVQSDSRCPMDAVCVWAGEAIVTLTLSPSANPPVQRDVRTTPGASDASYLSYVVRLTSLAPYPKSTQQIRPEDYVATLTVDTR